jgi:hypothetical protein
MLETALSYLEHGWSIIPLSPGDKRPYFALLPREDGQAKWEMYQTRQPTEEEVRRWFTVAPNANIGIVTGTVSGILVQDLDGPEGMSEAQRHGALPNTPMSRTGHGLHVVYRHPGGELPNFTRRAPGIDARGDGGYIAAPPSLHPNGHRYQWHISPDTPLADPPTWFLDMFNPDPVEEVVNSLLSTATRLPPTSGSYGAKALTQELDRLARAHNGTRNNHLVQSAFRMGQLIAEGRIGEEEAEQKLALVAQVIGLNDKEIRPTILSGIKAGKDKPRGYSGTSTQ